jgi:ATP-dependent HslUV protease subunit HslV
MMENTKICATTVCCVKKGKMTAIAADGQVTFGQTVVMKNNANKIKTLFDGSIICGFAGSVADAITLFDRLEKHLEKHDKHLVNACISLSKDWRMDKYLKDLDAMIVVADKKSMLLLTGNGVIIEPETNILAIGSGGNFALSAGMALLDANVDLNAEEIARKSLEIASKICIYTNNNIITQVVK